MLSESREKCIFRALERKELAQKDYGWLFVALLAVKFQREDEFLPVVEVRN
jgi:hypothetical protein